MLKKRVIPTLLWKNFWLVKWIGFDSSRRVWTVLPAIKVYTMREVDELIILDIESSITHIEINYDEIKDFCAECDIPITIWGWIDTFEKAKKIISFGADKVCLNTILYTDITLISEIAKTFWSQAVVCAIDIKKIDDTYVCFSHSWTVNTHKDPIEHAKELVSHWAWEIIITSIENDGTMKGYDLDIIEKLSNAVNIPVIASWGCWSYEDMYKAFSVGCSAVAAASIFHFTEMTPLEAKKYLKWKWIPVRS